MKYDVYLSRGSIGTTKQSGIRSVFRSFLHPDDDVETGAKTSWGGHLAAAE